jgi:cytochrome P450
MSTVTDQDLLSPELTGDPHAYYAELRASDPVHWAPASRAWLLTRYDDVVAAFGDPRLSSDRVRPLLGVLPAERRAEYGPMLEIISRWMVVTDPPAHTRLSRLASHAFRQQRVSAMSGWIAELVDELLDDFVAARGDDFLAGLAYPLPAAVIARMMGVPQQDRASSSTGPTSWPWSRSAPAARIGPAGTPARWPGSGSCRSTWPSSSPGAAASRART